MKLHSYGHGNHKITDLEHGDMIPVGGSHFASNSEMYLEHDIDHFSGFIAHYKMLLNQQSLQYAQNYLHQHTSSCPVEIFAAAHLLSDGLNHAFPHASNNLSARRQSYDSGTVKLSEQMRNGTAACSELAALGQSCLQAAGFDTHMIVGETCKNENYEFASEHAFLIIRDGATQTDWLYNVSRPAKDTGGKISPALYRLPSSSLELMAEIAGTRSRCLLAAEQVLTKDTRYFGVGHGGNLMPQHFIALPEMQKPAKAAYEP